MATMKPVDPAFVAHATVPLRTPKTWIKDLKTMPIRTATKTPLISAPPRSPALRTSAQATPSGNFNSSCSIIIGRRRGIIITPPAIAINVVSRKWKFFQIPSSTIAGTVKMIPAAKLSPELAIVWTTLFSSIVPRCMMPRSTPIEITDAGIAALTVIPA